MDNGNGIKSINLDSMEVYQDKIKYSDGDFAILDNIRFLPDIKALKIGFHIIIVCMEGRLQVDVNGNTVTASANEVLFFPSNVILDNYMISPVFECKILCMTDNVVQKLLQKKVEIWNKALYITKTSGIKLSDGDRDKFNHYYYLIINEIDNLNVVFGKEIVESLLRAALLFICSLIQKTVPQKNSDNEYSGSKSIMDNFLKTISSEPIKHRPVSFYAEKLCITPKYLTMVCQKYSGKTASDWLNEYVVQDINYYLKNTTKSIKEIADTLGFDNLSFFGKYVKQHFGSSPRGVRDSITNTAL